MSFCRFYNERLRIGTYQSRERSTEFDMDSLIAKTLFEIVESKRPFGESKLLWSKLVSRRLNDCANARQVDSEGLLFLRCMKPGDGISAAELCFLAPLFDELEDTNEPGCTSSFWSIWITSEILERYFDELNYRITIVDKEERIKSLAKIFAQGLLSDSIVYNSTNKRVELSVTHQFKELGISAVGNIPIQCVCPLVCTKVFELLMNVSFSLLRKSVRIEAIENYQTQNVRPRMGTLGSSTTQFNRSADRPRLKRRKFDAREKNTPPRKKKGFKRFSLEDVDR